MDTKHHVRIVGIKTIDFAAKIDRAAGQIKLAQCVVTSHHETKGEQVIVGELMLPRDLADTQTGEYLAEFELYVSNKLRVEARLVKLHSIAQSAPAPRPSASQNKDHEKKAA